jgi:hypothetical protein
VAGIRRDVNVVCLALANTDWYMRQLREAPARPVDVPHLPPVWRSAKVTPPDRPVHTMTDSMIAAAMSGYVVPQDQEVTLGPLKRTLKAGGFLLPNEILTLSVVQQNVGRRPVVWAITAGREFGGLGDYVVQQGLGFDLRTSKPDSTAAGLDFHRLAGAPLDISATEELMDETYRYAGLFQGDVTRLESTAGSIASTLGLPYTQLAYAYGSRGEYDKMEHALDRAMRLSPNPSLRAALAEMRLRGADTP